MVAPIPFFINRGSSIRVREQVAALISRGVMVDVITYPQGTIPVEIDHATTITRVPIGLGVATIPVGPSFYKIVYDIQIVVMTIVHMMKVTYDAVYAHNHEAVILVGIARKIVFWKHVPVVADIHGALEEEVALYTSLSYNWIRRIVHSCEAWLYRSAHTVLVSSPQLKNRVQWLAPKVHVVVAGDEITTPKYQPVVADTGNGSGVQTLVYTGGFTRDKGVEILLDAFRDAWFSEHQVHLVLAGSPIHVLDRLVTDHPHAHLIELVTAESPDQLEAVLQRASILVEPKYIATYQSSGKLARYIPTGLPVVAFDTPANRYLLGEDYDYVRLPEQSTHDVQVLHMRNKLIAVAGNAVLREQLAQHVRARNDQLCSSGERVNLVDIIHQVTVRI